MRGLQPQDSGNHIQNEATQALPEASKLPSYCSNCRLRQQETRGEGRLLAEGDGKGRLGTQPVREVIG